MQFQDELTEIFKKSPAIWTNGDLAQINKSFELNGRESTKVLMDKVISESND